MENIQENRSVKQTQKDYSMFLKFQIVQEIETDKLTISVATKKYGLDETEILKKLESLIAKEIYLQNNFDLNQLSTFLEIPVHHTSYFFNQYYKMSFANYRNQLRMEYAKKMIVSGYLNQNTIEALSWKCGFSSRSAFTKTFKTYTGLNPSEFS
jgi:AraC-like DNA-binding protein